MVKCFVPSAFIEIEPAKVRTSTVEIWFSRWVVVSHLGVWARVRAGYVFSSSVLIVDKSVLIDRL
jgi:hypothetical protein